MTRSYEAAAQARRDHDPDWRDLMPIRWHLVRWWSIHWPPLAVLLAVLAVMALAAEVGA
jgi:hypothetical protein